MKDITLLVLVCVIAFSCQSKKETFPKGREVYITNCISCHRQSGEGTFGYYPSLQKPMGIVKAQTERAIRLVKFGSGFENGMPPVALTNEEIKDVINYIQNNWGNKAPEVSIIVIESILNQ